MFFHFLDLGSAPYYTLAKMLIFSCRSCKMITIYLNVTLISFTSKCLLCHRHTLTIRSQGSLSPAVVGVAQVTLTGDGSSLSSLQLWLPGIHLSDIGVFGFVTSLDFASSFCP